MLSPSDWDDRHHRFGRRSAVGLMTPEEDLEEATRNQMAFIFPMMQRHLRAPMNDVLDFGCGYGRFDPWLLRVGFEVTGFDVSSALFHLAPDKSVTRHTGDPLVFLSHNAERFDLVWIFSVLGGIGDSLEVTATWIGHAMARGAQIVLTENTAEKTATNFIWTVRRDEEYVNAFAAAGVRLEKMLTFQNQLLPMTTFIGTKL